MRESIVKNGHILLMTTAARRPHSVFDLRSLIWGFGEGWTIVLGIHSDPENALQRAPLTFGRQSQPFGCNLEGGTFRLPPLHSSRGEGLGRKSGIGSDTWSISSVFAARRSAISSRTVFVIVSGSNGRGAETLLEPAINNSKRYEIDHVSMRS